MKKITVLLLMAALVFTLAACNKNNTNANTNANQETPPTGSQTEASEDVAGEEDAPPEQIHVGSISEETVLMNEKLQQVTYEEGEEPINPFYKKGTGADGMACYIVQIAGQDAATEVPMDNTAIYSMEEGESYIEQVSFSYEVEGETMDVQQYRLYINPAQD